MQFGDVLGAFLSLCGLTCIIPFMVFGLPMFFLGRAWERGWRLRSPLGRPGPDARRNPGYGYAPSRNEHKVERTREREK